VTPVGWLQPVAPGAEQVGPPTVEQLEQLALDNSPAVARAAAQLRALHGKWLQVGLPPNPTVGYLADDIGEDGTAGKQGGYVGQQLVTAGKLALDRELVCHEIAQAEQHLAAARQRVRTDVRTGYYDVLIAQEKVDLSRELLQLSERAVQASRRLLEAKEIPRVGLLQTEIETHNARILVRQAEHELEGARQRLATLLGQPELTAPRLAGDLEAAGQVLNWSQQLERLESQSPILAAAIAARERARRAVDRAVAQARPDVELQLALQHDDAGDDTVAAVQLGLPLPLWNRNQGGIAQAQAELGAEAHQVQRARRELAHRLASTFQDYADARYEVEEYAKDILPRARETLDLVTAGYQQGEVGYLEMLTAERTFFQTTLAYLDALRKLWSTHLLIDGLLLDQSLQPQPAT